MCRVTKNDGRQRHIALKVLLRILGLAAGDRSQNRGKLHCWVRFAGHRRIQMLSIVPDAPFQVQLLQIGVDPAAGEPRQTDQLGDGGRPAMGQEEGLDGRNDFLFHFLAFIPHGVCPPV